MKAQKLISYRETSITRIHSEETHYGVSAFSGDNHLDHCGQRAVILREGTASYSQEPISLGIWLPFPRNSIKKTTLRSLSSPPLTQCIYFPWSWTLANNNSYSLNILPGFRTACDGELLHSLVCVHLKYSSSHTSRDDWLQKWNTALLVLYLNLQRFSDKYQASFHPMKMLAKSYSLSKSKTSYCSFSLLFKKIHLRPTCQSI